MQTVTYELALRALNEAVAKKGPDHFYKKSLGLASYGSCWNVTLDGEPDCIVGHALLWLGVPAEWFMEDDRRGLSAGAVCPILDRTGVLRCTDTAIDLFAVVQVDQDAGRSWGEAVVNAHLGADEYARLGIKFGRA